MNILIAASEAAPFAKTGGLADVCGALPAELAQLGCNATLIIPGYRQAISRDSIENTGIKFSVPVGDKTIEGSFLKTTIPNTKVPVYLVQQDQYFNRDGIYQQSNGSDYGDNCARFVFFSRAVMEAIRLFDLKTDIIHANDWQTGLIPAYLKTEYRLFPRYEKIAAMFTIHNLAYQGSFWHWDMALTGLDWKYFNYEQMESYGRLNLIKTGIAFADAISTVSPSYAREIQSYPLGCGLEGILKYREKDLFGILNGIDTTVWNPATDPQIAVNYDLSSWKKGKAACKAALQVQMGLPVQPDAPVIGSVGRLSYQKGYDLIAEIMRQIAPQHPAQWLILGTGEACYQDMLSKLQAEFPDKIAVRLIYSDKIAHQIIAGSDLFLMPSRYEPCGLTQMYSLRYGTIPIVHATGGLADTVINTTAETLADETANGFSFGEDNLDQFSACINNALWTYYQKGTWDALTERAMQEDWSWKKSAQEYVKLYKQIKK